MNSKSSETKVMLAPAAGTRAVPLFWPHISEKAISAIQETLRTRWLGQGPKVEALERAFESFVRASYAITVNSCTSALHLALLLSNVKKGDEVITTPLTCSATNIPILYCGAKPVFADIQQETLNIDPQSIASRITKRTKAIVIVDWAGLPCGMDEIMEIGRRHKIPVIEDAAHAIGASYKGKPIGSITDATCFSFQAIKQITSGDGGILTVKRENWAKRAKLLRWYGIDRTFTGDIYKKFKVKEVGYKYHMHDLAATLILAQIEDIKNILARRKELADRYRRELTGVNGLTLTAAPNDRVSGNWLFTVQVERRADFQAKLSASGIESGQVHIRCDVIPIFGGKKQRLPVMNAVEPHYTCIPLHNHLSDDDVEHVIRTIQSGW